MIDAGVLRARPLPQLIAAVLEHARNLAANTPSAGWFHPGSGAPTPANIDSLVRILRPSFEFFESPKSRRRQRDDELLRYTSEQYIALDAMNANPRVVFEGAAGTGKTLLALEETRRAVLRGDRGLLCCFNRLLGSWLRKEAEPFGEAAVTSTLHSFLLQVTGLTVPDGANSSFWERELPDAALDRALAGDVPPFDVLVVDEAQDLLHNAYLDVLEVLLDGGLKDGRWRMFGDFEQQAIYRSSSAGVTDVLAPRAPGTPRFLLTRNCRNTPRIASFVKLLAAYERGYADVLRPDSGIEPETIYYDSPEDQDRKLVSLLERLFGEGYSGREIVILSPRAHGSAAQQITDLTWAERLKPAQAELPGGVRYCTVHSFKGLEAPVIIVTDVSSIGTEADHSLFYTAVTRATERLYVLALSQLKPAVLELLLRQASTGSSS